MLHLKVTCALIGWIANRAIGFAPALSCGSPLFSKTKIVSSYALHSSIQQGVWSARIGEEKNYEYWLDLRAAENTFAQMALTQLFYGVRTVLDDMGVALPNGSAVDGVLFNADTFDRADGIGAGLPLYLTTKEDGADVVNATIKTSMETIPIILLAAETPELLADAESKARTYEIDNSNSQVIAIALPPEATLWSQALTGVQVTSIKEDNA